MTEQNWIAKSIVPKSDQLNAEDLLSGPITVTVQDVKQGSADQPIAILVDGGRQPYKPCKTMRKLLVFCWTDQAKNWIGKRLTLYADPDVKWAGVSVGGIRISHLSGIENDITLMLSETRGKRKAVTVKPLNELSVLDQWRPKFSGKSKQVLAMSGRIAKIKTPDESMTIEADLSQWEDADEKTLLVDFMTAMLETV